MGNVISAELAAELIGDGYADVTRLLVVPQPLTSVWAKTDDEGDLAARLLVGDTVIGNMIILANRIYAETWQLGSSCGAGRTDEWSPLEAMNWVIETCDLPL